MKGSRVGSQDALSNPWGYLLLAFLITWSLWIPTAIFGQGATPDQVEEFPWLIPMTLGVFVPGLLAVAIISRRARAIRADFWRRALGFRAIGGRWYLFIALIYPLCFGLATLLEALVEKVPLQFETLDQIRANPAFLFGLLAVMFVNGIVEETGWRGIALDGLQSRYNALIASLLLGLVHGFWHLPLFFVRGTWQQAMGIGTLAFYTFFAFPIFNSVLYTWVYNNNGRSILSASLLHFMGNLSLNLFLPVSSSELLYVSVIIALAALVVVLAWGPEDLRGRGRRLLSSNLAGVISR